MAEKTELHRLIEKLDDALKGSGWFLRHMGSGSIGSSRKWNVRMPSVTDGDYDLIGETPEQALREAIKCVVSTAQAVMAANETSASEARNELARLQRIAEGA